MSQNTRFHFFQFFLAIVFLRVVVGFHFFKEGESKLRTGTFSAKYFLGEAKGPAAGFFRSFLDDPDGVLRLCLQAERPVFPTKEELSAPKISPDFTFEVWNDYLNQLRAKGKIDESLESRAQAILEEHKGLLSDFLSDNSLDIAAYFGSQGRLQGFARDGENREMVASQVDSLRGQVDTIKTDRNKKFLGWTKEVETIWNSLEDQINYLASVPNVESRLVLHRPFDQPYSWQKMIDRIVPWFDLIVGILLILGLFTRFASLAAALFLISVIATQPPFVSGATPTYYQFVEMAACLTLFAVGAGSFAGLDHFRNKPLKRASENAEAASPSQ